MKLRHPQILKGVGFVGGWLIRCWVGTLRYRQVQLDPTLSLPGPDQVGRFIYSFWHETILLPAALHGHSRAKVIISEHADGEMIAQACRHLGFGVVRGSTTRGGVNVVREVMRLEGMNVAITPDGPRGPRREVQAGAVFLASQTGMPLVPVGFGVRYAKRLRSWDKFLLPCPFSPAVGVVGRAIKVPKDVDRRQLIEYKREYQRAMDDVTRRAEEAAARESW